MLESDRLPNNVMKVPEVYSLYCQSSYIYRRGEGRGEEMEKGRKREGGEERRRGEKGRRGEGERREGEEKGRGRGGEEVHMLYCHNVSLSLQ